MQLAPFLMFVVLFVLILLNIPVAFALFVTAAVFALLFWGAHGLYICFQGVWSVINNWSLVALPLFVLMGAVLERAGVVDEMFLALRKLLGGFRGALAVIVILLGYIIGAMSGVVAAAVAMLGILMYPVMRREGYPEELAAGVILGASVLPQIVPPSFNMIVYGSHTGVSVGALFAGGVGLGTMIALLYIVYVVAWCQLHRDRVPVHVEREPLLKRLSYLKYFAGPAVIILSVWGTIYTGMATPTEAAGMGALVTLLYVLIRRRVSRRMMVEALATTLRITSMAVWLMAGGSAFSAVFSGLGGKAAVTSFLLSLPAARVTVLAVSIAIIFVLGMFVDPVSIIMIMAPILSPAVTALGYDPVWWGVVFNGTLLTSYLTPPVGMALYYFMGIQRDVKTELLFRCVWSYVVLLIAALAIAIAVPDTVMVFVRTLMRTR